MVRNENAEIVVTNGHVAAVVRALKHDISGLTPEMVGDDAVVIAAKILALMDELDGQCSHSVAMMLAVVNDNYEPQIRDWMKVRHDFVDHQELHSANRLIEMAKHGVRTRYESWEKWKGRTSLASNVSA